MNILEEIVAVKKEEVKKLRSKYTYRHFSDSAFFERPVLSMLKHLTKNADIAVIAEIKKASPSAGIIRPDFNHMELAEIYMANQAEAISILTDLHFFKGSISYLQDIAAFREVPLLRKDFIIDDYQIFEAKAHGADCVLLIAEILSAGQLSELSHAANEAGLETLVEMHSADQLAKINQNVNKLIGINNRNLENFSVDLQTTADIVDKIASGTTVVSESGIRTAEDLDFLKKTGIDAILVGEHLMRSENVANELQRLMEWCRREG